MPSSDPPPGSMARRVASLLATSAVGRLPQAMAAAALVRLAVDGGVGLAFAGILTAAYVIASTVGTPLLSRMVDRTGRPVAILGASVAVATVGLVGVALFVRIPAVALGCAVIAGAAFPPLEPVLRGLWPRFVPPGRGLDRLFALDAAAQEVLFILGPLIAVLAAALFGGSGAVLVMAAAGAIGTVLFCLHRVVGRAAARHAHADRTPALRVRTVQRLIVVQVLVGLPVGVLTITAARYAEVAGAPGLVGWGLAVNAGGALIGALVVARFPVRAAPDRAARLFIVTLALLYAPTAALTTPPVVWLLSAFLAGVSLPPLLTQVFSLTQRAAPPSALTEANGWVVSAFSVGIGAGTAIAGLFASAGGTPGVSIAVWGASAVALLAVLIAPTGSRPRQTVA